MKKQIIVTKNEIRIRSPYYCVLFLTSIMLFILFTGVVVFFAFIILLEGTSETLLSLIVYICEIYFVPLMMYIVNEICYKLSKTNIVVDSQGIALFKKGKRISYISREDLNEIICYYHIIAMRKYVFYSKSNSEISFMTIDDPTTEIEQLLNYKIFHDLGY